MINNVTLTGRLTKDINVQYTGNGTAVASFTLAVSRNYTNEQGEREADFINCVIWRKSAEALAQHTSKGTLIGITGRIQTRNYENEQGQRIYITEVVASEFTFLESKKQVENNGYSNQNVNTPNNSTMSREPAYSPQPQNNRYSNTQNRGDVSGAVKNINTAFSDPFVNGKTLDIKDSDLPF